jgi:hypothetical protein
VAAGGNPDGGSAGAAGGTALAEFVVRKGLFYRVFARERS